MYLSAGSAEPLALAALLAADAQRLDGVTLAGSFVPGVNAIDYAALHPGVRVATLLLPSPFRSAFAAGRVDVLPFSYVGFADHLGRTPLDIAIVQVAPPDADGRCSLGVAADFAPIALANTRLRVAFVNADMPRPRGGWTVAASDFDLMIPCAHPPIAIGAGKPSATIDAIAAHAASLVPDGATLQVGLGGAPAAVLSQLRDRRNLRIHSGMVSDEIIALAQGGALAEDGHRTGIAIGSKALYAWLEEARGLDFVPTPDTHGALAIAAVPGFTAINSALSIDLFGQVNLEWRDNVLVSGVGGAPDFVAGARLSPGGRSILALPATAGRISRIVPRLDTPTVSLPRQAIDWVVTEHGAVAIRDLPLDRRAQALIGIAAPEHRDALSQAWTAVRGTL